MISSKQIFIAASLLVAAPVAAQDGGPACTPGTPVHEEPNYDLNKQASSWRFIVAPADGQCNQFIVTINGQSITTAPVAIKDFAFAPNCKKVAGEMGVALVKGKLMSTYCYNSLTTKQLLRMHQFILFNDDPGRPYVASYVVWDDGSVGSLPKLTGVGSDKAGSRVDVWLVGETPPKP